MLRRLLENDEIISVLTFFGIFVISFFKFHVDKNFDFVIVDIMFAIVILLVDLNYKIRRIRGNSKTILELFKISSDSMPSIKDEIKNTEDHLKKLILKDLKFPDLIPSVRNNLYSLGDELERIIKNNKTESNYDEVDLPIIILKKELEF